VRYEGKKKLPFGDLSNFDGQYVIDLKKVFLSDSFVVDNLEALCYIVGDKAELKDLSCRLAGSLFQADAKLEYLRDMPKSSYVLFADSTLAMQDIGKLCRMVSGSGSVPMEGSGKVSLQLASEGKSVEESLMSVQGVLHVDCENGTLRLPHSLGEKFENVAGSAEMLSSMLAQRDDKFTGIKSLIEKLGGLDYDTVTVNVKRDENLNIVVDKFNVVGPEIYANAYGQIFHLKYKNFGNSPVEINVEVNVAGELGKIFDGLGLVTDRPRHSKYMQGQRFFIRGTVDNPDYSSFMKLLYQIF
jgi:hypothetical protein